jgi:hypothetical protein
MCDNYIILILQYILYILFCCILRILNLLYLFICDCLSGFLMFCLICQMVKVEPQRRPDFFGARATPLTLFQKCRTYGILPQRKVLTPPNVKRKIPSNQTV